MIIPGSFHYVMWAMRGRLLPGTLCKNQGIAEGWAVLKGLLAGLYNSSRRQTFKLVPDSRMCGSICV